MDSVDLDSKVVERFDGKVMAIVGFEVDQVRLCELEHGQDQSLVKIVMVSGKATLSFVF